MASRVLCAGHVNWDVTLRVEVLPEPDGEARITSQRRAGGGSAANVAAALVGFGVPAGLIGSVGDDEHGRLARRELEAAGVDVSGVVTVEDGETAVKYLVVDGAGEVMVLGNDGANEAIAPEDVDAGTVGAADHLHLTSQRPDTAAALAASAAGTGVTVSVDPGRRPEERDFSGALEYADVVFLNDRESRGVLDDGDGVHGSTLDDRVVVVKHGSEGATVHTPRETHSHPGFSGAVETVDTTGAGDAFAAGFIAVSIDGGGYERALEFANACGALATGAEGARAALTHEAVEAFVRERRPAGTE